MLRDTLMVVLLSKIGKDEGHYTEPGKWQSKDSCSMWLL